MLLQLLFEMRVRARYRFLPGERDWVDQTLYSTSSSKEECLECAAIIFTYSVTVYTAPCQPMQVRCTLIIITHYHRLSKSGKVAETYRIEMKMIASETS